jgi:hypothetical protein
MTVKPPLKSFFNTAWMPLTFFVAVALLHVLVNFSSLWTLQTISFYLLVVGWIVLLISAIYHLTKRKWINGLLMIIILIAAIPAYVYYYVVTIWTGQSLPDTFADDLKIPIGISIHELTSIDFEGNQSDSMRNSLRNTAGFEVYGSYQPGLFEYDFWTPRIDSGTIYLKAFEVTKNYRLSAERLSQTSAVIVYNGADSIVRFSSRGTMTIYEGDWGKPYAARFEVWFKANNDQQDRKLMEKIYKIEGWQR